MLGNEHRSAEESGEVGRTYPSLFLSTILGIRAWTYVEVQMKSRMARRRDWKLKIAVWRVELVEALSWVREDVGVDRWD